MRGALTSSQQCNTTDYQFPILLTFGNGSTILTADIRPDSVVIKSDLFCCPFFLQTEDYKLIAWQQYNNKRRVILKIIRANYDIPNLENSIQKNYPHQAA